MPNELDFTINEAAVVPVPVDATLSIAGQAADAKAVGDALADKADKSELATAITVNGQAADAQGAILVTAEHVPMDDNESETVAQAIAAQAARTGEDIPINGSTGAVSIEAALDAKVDEVIAELGGDPISLEHGGTGATSAAGVKVVLGLQSAGQGVNILQPTGNGQVLSLLANVINTNSILDGHRVTLLVEDSAIRLFDVTIGANVWQLPVPVGVAQGGTGATSGPAALANLGIATKTLSGTTSANGNIAAGLDPSRYVVLCAYSAGRICTPYLAVSGTVRSTYIHLSAFDGTPVASTDVAVAVVYADLGTGGVPV